MWTARSFLDRHRLSALLVAAAFMLAALAACQDGQPGPTASPTPLVTASPTFTSTLPHTPTPTPNAIPTPTPKATPAPTPTPDQEEGEMTSNRIAYISSDGNLFTIRPDGTDARKLTVTDLRGRVSYAWPTWSPDGTSLAVSRVTASATGAFFSLEVVNASTGSVTKIYDNEPNTLQVAQGSPHYVYWSPDSRHITFIAGTPSELTLFISTPKEGRGPDPLVGRTPLYFSWAGNSSAFLIHRGQDLLLVSPDDVRSESSRPVGIAGLGFRAPALSPDATKMVYAHEDHTGAFLYVADTQPSLTGAKSILDIGSSSAFLWSPTRDEIAVAHTIGGRGIPYDRVTIVSSDGGSETIVAKEQVLAFFWSPDGEKLAYVAFDMETQAFLWKYVDRSTGEATELLEFSPSPEFVTMIFFFDQYAYSNSVWSPDSSQIVFSGTVGPGRPSRNGGSAGADRVYVLDVKAGSIPREIATSRFATWSWR